MASVFISRGEFIRFASSVFSEVKRVSAVCQLDIAPLSVCPLSAEYFAYISDPIFYDALMTIFQVLGKHSVDFHYNR